MTNDNAEIARRFVAAVEKGATGEALASFFTDDVEQHELPNLLFKNGMKRDRATILASAEKGQHVLSSQSYEITNLVTNGGHVAIEMRWRGVLKVALGNLKPGDALTGQFAFFMQIENGLIKRMRNYDCYDPF